MVEVRTARPIPYGAKLVSVTGTCALENRGDSGLFFQLSNAQVR